MPPRVPPPALPPPLPEVVLESDEPRLLSERSSWVMEKFRMRPLEIVRKKVRAYISQKDGMLRKGAWLVNRGDDNGHKTGGRGLRE